MSMDIAPKLSKKFFDRLKWASLKTDVRTQMMNHNMEWITDGGQSLFTMIQNAVEAALVIVPVVQGVAIGPDGIALQTAPVLTAWQKALAAKATTSRTKVSTNIDDFTEIQMRAALASAKGGSIKVSMNVERARYLQALFRAAWNSATDMGVDDDTELKDMHNAAHSTYIRTKSIQFINVIRDACTHSLKDRTRDSEALRTIVNKTEYNDLTDIDWVKCLDETWTNPAVRLWLEMLNRFEGISDAININFTKEFGELLTTKKDRSVQEALLAYDTLVKPIAKNFKTLSEFVEYLGCTVGEQTII